MKLREILERLGAINVRMNEIKLEANKAETTAERMEELDAEVDALVNERNTLTAEKVRLMAEAQNFTPVVNNGSNGQTAKRSEDKYATLGYRQAFMDFVMRGTNSPILSRADSSTKTTDVSAVIVPSTITDRLFEKRSNAGSIFARVRKANYPAGMTIPLVNFKPELEWVAENGKSDRKSATTGSVVFNGYKGQIRLAISLEAQIKALEQFEAALVDRILKACARGYDKAIVAGTGSGQPTGILTGADYAKKAVKVTAATIGDYATWVKIWAKLPLAEEPTSLLHINAADWRSHILGMKDERGRVIALDTIGFGGAPVHQFMGREVVLLEDQGLPTFDSVVGNATASKDTAFAYFCNDEDYIFNSNMQLTLRQYADEETDERIHKATVIADGKLVVDDSLIVICRGADAQSEDAQS